MEVVDSFYVYLVDKYGNPVLFRVSRGDGDNVLCFTEVENPDENPDVVIIT